MKTLLLLLICLLNIYVVKCQNPVELGSIQIGEQTWMDKNLDAIKFRNGDPIPQAKNISEWLTAGENSKPTWCFYEFDEKNGAKYGKLYNWYAVRDKRGLAPIGWRIPTDSDWVKLFEFFEGESLAGEALKSKNGWNDEGNGTNSSGFNALPGGAQEGESFNYLGQFGMWWSSNQENETSAWLMILESGSRSASRSTSSKNHGLSVRCLKEN